MITAAPVMHLPPESSAVPGEVWPSPDASTLRVLSWNLRNMLGEVPRIHRVIEQSQPDVVCLQEAHRWLLSRNLIAHLARRTGLSYLVGGRRSAGTAMLVSLRTRIVDAAASPLAPASRHLAPKASSLVPRPQGFTRAVVGLPGTPAVSVVSAHVPWQAEIHARHLEEIRTFPDGSPVDIIAGDFNDTPGDVAWSHLMTDTRDPAPLAYPTYPSNAATSRLDGILVAPRLRVTRYGWPSAATGEDVIRASDHRPVCADIVLMSDRGA